MEAKERFDIVFNMYSVQEEIYFPSAYIVKINPDGKPGYIQQKAVPETIGSFPLPAFNKQVLNKLFAIHESFIPQNVANKFNSNLKKGKVVELPYLLKDPELTKDIKSYVGRRLDEWLSIVKNEGFMLSIDLPRKDEAGRHLINIQNPEFKPELYFSLKNIGIEYQLKVGHNPNLKILDSTFKVISNSPAWILMDKNLYKIQYITATMLKPFQQKTHLYIPPKAAHDYFEKFIIKVAAKADVHADGFDVVQSNQLQSCSLQICKDIFTEEWVIVPHMHYQYDSVFAWSDDRKTKTGLFSDQELKIVKVNRDEEEEKKYIAKLKEFGFEMNVAGSFYKKTNSKNPFFLMEWLTAHKTQLEAKGLYLENIDFEDRKIYSAEASIRFEKDVQSDWFDVYAVVHVGDFTFPFNQLIKHIKDHNRFYLLPNNTYFLIPEEWFSKYENFAKFAIPNGKSLRFNKNQYTILEDLKLLDKEKKSNQFKDLDEVLQTHLKAELRPYQKDGVRWMLNLYHKGLGGCLADDMGLGKTLQTISVLIYAKTQKNKVVEEVVESQEQLDLFLTSDTSEPSYLRALIVLPASLVFNWKKELEKFAPHLKIYTHTGPHRKKVTQEIAEHDVVLSTYHTVARDLEVLSSIHWEYMVLDESQQIKNKDAKIFQAVNSLESNHKLALSGTPIENSLSDLWSQMQFINPELLGNFNFFKNEFILPIEKKADEEKKKKLYQLVGPYLLRRTKEEVAKDLPPLTQKIFYSNLSEGQEKLYEAEKSMVRNYLLDVYDEKNGSHKMHVLQSLMKLRQIANHPILAEYENIDSGKFEDVINHWKTVVKSGHKVLIFSSFVKYLEQFQVYFDERQVPYALLTGQQSPATRKKEIEKFEQSKNIQTFLISIKAGGVGLNLTQADYVFILDPWWNPFVEHQAIARAHRIGQDKQVMAIKFVTKNTLEEKILMLQEKKSKLAEEIISESTKIKLNKQDLTSLLE